MITTDQTYIDILEKTNQQLNLLYNPYGVIVGALAVLFTALTIIAAVIIYFQSKDYKDKMEEDRKNYDERIRRFLASYKEIIEEENKKSILISEKIDEILKEYKNKLKESSETQKMEIQKAIDRLEIEKLTLKNPITVKPSSTFPYFSALGNSLHTCSKCGFGFLVDQSSQYSGVYCPTITCPKCGNTEKI
jgi:DNA replicative helicase MCM subunit Mcm2 (Cdc46/Mcm family)